MLLEVLHVAERVDADAAADDADDKGHEQGKRVEVEAVLHFDALRDDEVEDKRPCNLDDGEYASERIFVLHAEVQNDGRDEHADNGACDIRSLRRELDLQPRRSEVCQNQPDRADPDDDACRAHDHAPRHFTAHREQNCRDKCREQDKEPDECHAASPFLYVCVVTYPRLCGLRTAIPLHIRGFTVKETVPLRRINTPTLRVSGGILGKWGSFGDISDAKALDYADIFPELSKQTISLSTSL